MALNSSKFKFQDEFLKFAYLTYECHKKDMEVKLYIRA